jgi:hypothetical protein
MDNKSESANRPKRQRIQKSTEEEAPLLPMGDAPESESIVDPSESEPVKNFLKKKNLNLK